MKTIRNLFFVAFAAMTVAGCQEELANPNDEMQETGNVVTFTGSVENALTKTTMWYEDNEYQTGDEFPTMFMNADHITVNGTESGDLTKNDDNGTNISFTVAGVTPPYYAVTSIHVNSYESGVYTVQVNGTGNPQDYRLVRSGKATSFDSQADILAAYSKDETSLRFKHMCTFLAITVNSEGSSVPDNIKSVYIRQAGEQPNIAGKWNLTYDGEGNAPVLTPDELTEVIAYDCTDEGVAQDKAMIIGIPAYNYADGLIITIKDVNGKFASFKIPSSKTDFTDMGGVITPFNPTFNPGSGEIMTAQDWNDFADAVNSGKDWELYRWLGNGTVKLGADINDDDVELKSVTAEFKYVFDGNGKTITRNKATSSLFSLLTGEIHKLTLDGELKLSDAEDAPFVKHIHAGAKITGCTNNMNITFDIKTHCYVTGIAAVALRNDIKGLEVLEISDCTNNGKIEGTVDVSAANYNTAVAGILGDIRASVGDYDYSLVLKNCKNTAPITLSPKSGETNTYGMTVCGVGGIIGYVRSAASITLTNCDNSGDITVKADLIASKTGLKATPTAVGGIIGIGTGHSGGILPLTGIDYTLTDCDNAGTIHNCMVNSSAGTESSNKVYTGGLAGALVGKSDKYATITSCTNTGDVYSYDVCGDNAATTSATSAVAGGFIGFGGHLNMDKCTVACQLGNGQRQSVAWGGVLGFAMMPFNLTNSSVNVVGYFNRISGYNLNRAVIAVVPVKYSTNKMSPAPSTSQSGTVSGSSITCKMLTTKDYPTAEMTDNLRESTETNLQFDQNPFSDGGKVKGNMTRGVGSTANAVITIGDDNTYAVGALN